MVDAVNHPAHYNKNPSGIECIDIIRHLPHNRGAAIKYIWRAGEKDPSKEVEDLQKAIWYLEDEIKRLADSYAPIPENRAREEHEEDIKDLIKKHGARVKQ